MTAVYITLIIVSGIVIVSLAGIAWLWRTTMKVGGIPGMNRDAAAVQKRLDGIEAQMKDLRAQVDDIKARM